MIIAIDGTAAAGKSTLARRIAQHYSLPHLDTGSLYRAVARDVLLAGRALDDVEAAADAASGSIRRRFPILVFASKGRGEAASVVAAFPQVREALLTFQRNFAARPSGAVVEGRDIGTVVCPQADAKIFVTASAESRASRRYKELLSYGVETTEEAVLREIKDRDRRDSERPISPLKPADDALLLDTTELDIEKAFAAALDLIDKVASRG